MSAPEKFTITGPDQFSQSLDILSMFNFSLQSPLNDFVGTVRLQRRFKGETEWRTIDPLFTDTDLENNPNMLERPGFEPEGAEYRFGTAAGEHTAGTVEGRLRNTKN